MLNFSNYKSVLCLSGELPNKDFFKSIRLPVIAADGAANQLMQMNITPEIVIGDLDSVLPEFLEMIPSHYHYDQNYCDFEKSLQYLEKMALLPTVIVGINGGYLDHVLNNINHFMQAGNVLYAPPLSAFILRAGEHKVLKLPINTKISLLGIPMAQITTQGLKWNLNNQALSFPGHNSCFNRTIHEAVEIKVSDGQSLILLYDEAASLKP